MEARVYAEDPDMNFLPQSGTIHYLREPRHRESENPDENVRVDTGVREGDEISIFFDPMISKLIVKGTDRQDAIRKMHRALDDYKIIGLKNNITFLQKILEAEDFFTNNYDTDFIEKNHDFLLPERTETLSHEILFARAAVEVLKGIER